MSQVRGGEGEGAGHRHVEDAGHRHAEGAGHRHVEGVSDYGACPDTA